MVKCPKCNSNDVDHANTGLPYAMQCLNCGYIFPKKLPKGAKGSSPNAWPFPTSLRPNDRGLPKYNPNNEEESPL